MAENNLIDLKGLQALAEKVRDEYATKQSVSDDLDSLKSELVSKISSVYSAGGSIDSPESSLLSEENIGKVYNVSNEFSIDDDTMFVDQVGNSYPAGTNIVVVADGSSTYGYRFDVLSGFVDLSDYVTSENVRSLIDSSILGQIASSEEVDEMLKEVFSED